MNFKHLSLALAALLPSWASLAQDAATSQQTAAAKAHIGFLSPASNAYRELLPGNYTNLYFTLRNDDWQDRVRLPTSLSLSERSIYLANLATSPRHLEVDGVFTHLPSEVRKVMLPAGQNLAVSNRMSMAWRLSPKHLREINGPNEARWRIPSNGRKLATVLNLRDGQHVGQVGLPDGAHSYDTVTIRHTATWPSSVIAADTQFPRSNLRIESGDVHHYVFDPFFRVWKLNHATYRPVLPNDASRKTSTARTLVTATNENFRGYYLNFPDSPSDRDRRRFKIADSKVIDPGYGLKISAGNIFDREAHIWTRPGEAFEFIFVNDNGPGSGYWHALRFPVQRIDVDKERGGEVDNAAAQLTWVSTGGGTVTLPNAHQRLTRLVVENVTGVRPHPTPRTTTIVGPGVSDKILPGEQVSYRLRDYKWIRETTTVDVVFAVSDRLGEIGSKDIALELMRESLKKTNDALDNSGATFRFREAAVRNITVPYYLPTYAIPEWIANHASQVISDSGADGLFFGGVADGCNGVHHSKPRKQFAVAMNLLCSTDMLREEMGKALGLKVNGMQGVPVIGAGNKLPLYPTPLRFVDDGNRAINPGQRDEVQHMNGVAAEVARYGHAR
ncbi:hypothetical protein [Stenotrophomonas sepilia]|uniref:hypothetical protein n=1 Tax=Stenotrophomonas sepilia TaxID=2860290 RepID=UPI002E79C8AB|nr:hypothetical protein [Stenotrophomonas sepilia]